MFKACTRKYSHIGILRTSAYIQVGAAPKRVWGPLNFIQKLKFLQHKQPSSVNSDKNFIASSIPEK